MPSKIVHVAVGVIRRHHDGQEQILLSKRLDHQHQGGLWEFPGGKVERGESVETALARELSEELAIDIGTKNSADHSSLEPLIQIRHDYSDKSVLLDVWNVRDFKGVPKGQEGQDVRWVELGDLQNYDFPAANVPIVTACQLPDQYAITPSFDSLEHAKRHLKKLLDQNVELVLFRQPHLTDETYVDWLTLLLADLPLLQRRLMATAQIFSTDRSVEKISSNISSSAPSKIMMECHGLLSRIRGVHLSFKAARSFSQRPIPEEKLLAISCHNTCELEHAQRIASDFVTVSPVNQTGSHPDAAPLGWEAFSNLVTDAVIPVFALGGMTSKDKACAKTSGAQGVAGISMWLPDSSSF